MEDEEFVGCISCMNTNDLCDLFALYAENTETYAKMFETCFDIKVKKLFSVIPNHLKYICSDCVDSLEKSICFKGQTTKSLAMLQSVKVKLCNEQTPKYVPRERKKCHMCKRDFSQKQILNKHLWIAHGFEVEKRKAFICPLCDKRVSYGSNFSAHLLLAHCVKQQVEQLEFHNMDDFMIFKSAIQEETKYRFRKTTASKQTIKGVRSRYMCSQSGVYVYQGKGKSPERHIYITGKACPAHMIVTETMDRVLVTFYKTHVGHGRETVEESAWMCDTCDVSFDDADKFRDHVATHGLELIPCQYCDDILAVTSTSLSQKDDEIIRQDFDGPHDDGSYRWALQTSGGIFHEQKGSLEPGSTGEPGLFVQGQYQYTAPDGQVINVLYTAGENGFEAKGDHIPTPPPIPIAIQRALDYLATKAPSTEY